MWAGNHGILDFFHPRDCNSRDFRSSSLIEGCLDLWSKLMTHANTHAHTYGAGLATHPAWWPRFSRGPAKQVRTTAFFLGSSEEFVGGFGCHRNQQDLRSGSTEGFRPSRLCPRITPERRGEGLMRGRRRRGSPNSLWTWDRPNRHVKNLTSIFQKPRNS